MFCGNCGNELREGAKFCPKCGTMTRQGRQEAQPPAEPEQIAPPIMPEAEPVSDTPRQQVRQQRPAAGKARQAVRLRAMPVQPAQDAGPAPQAEQAKPSNPPEPVEPPQQPEAPAQPSIVETGPARLAPAADSVKDTRNNKRIQCGNCGTELNAGAKFCPECGMPVGQAPAKEPSSLAGPAAEAKAKPAPNKNLIKFAAIAGAFVLVIVLLAALGGGNSIPDGFVANDNQFGLAFDMTLEEFVERFNSNVTENLSSNNKSMMYLSVDSMEKGGTSTFGEDTYAQSLFSDLFAVGVATYEGKVTSISVASAYGETIEEVGASLVANILMVIGTNHTDDLNETTKDVIRWVKDTADRQASGEPMPIQYYEHNVLYYVTGQNDYMLYMIRATSDKGYERWNDGIKGALAEEAESNSPSTGSNEATSEEILQTMKELSLDRYPLATAYDLLAAAGARMWVLQTRTDTALVAVVSGNGMSFELILDLQNYSYRVNAVNTNGSYSTGEACNIICDSLLGSMYDAIRNGYLP